MFDEIHFCDVIIGSMASQIISLTIVYSINHSGADQWKHQPPRVTGLRAGNSAVAGELPAQMASNAENISIWWRHHVARDYGLLNDDWTYSSVFSAKWEYVFTGVGVRFLPNLVINNTVKKRIKGFWLNFRDRTTMIEGTIDQMRWCSRYPAESGMLFF